ncbi:MAG: ROK family protein [Candidatus Omnitrophica bacterium]|nr:ROK family protein [Candidatus Omnitrophota bacterium]MDE2008600.1 ROK family protein [Candidatus Omnitrophota bacterium]MDE2214066.1 ROK family protein [Candidatus Omnitrophota bacterium]MDE2230956.1 ROK family protein [Candidatus Omnitrophota bacterium]
MDYYIGLDIGGTKIAGALVSASGRVFARTKTATPKRVHAQDIFNCLTDTIDELIHAAGVKPSSVKGVGVGVPGIVDTRNHNILAAPNIALTGFPLSASLRRRYRIPVVMTNDVNAGLLGEAWKGAAKGLSHVVGIFPGTGVGGAVIIDGKLLLGAQGAATELGHVIVSIGGPRCHCGNRGCLEALTSRWAIERDIREGVKAGKKTVVLKLNDGKLDMIKSRILREALARNDALVKSVLARAAVVLGKTAVSLNHTFNPQAIIFGGGVIKACGHFILPIVARELDADPFFKKFNTCRILASQLGDDAVVLGAARLAQQH